MNLKDNRGDGSNKNNKEKFEACKSYNVVAIGWVGREREASTDKNFNLAYDSLQQMRKGDLVWVKNPETKKQYLCEIINEEIILLPESLHNKDISCGRSCTFHEINSPPNGITFNQIVSRHTIEKTHNQSLINKTLLLFAESFQGQ